MRPTGSPSDAMGEDPDALPALERAPGRGRYDRAIPRQQRQATQRARLDEAVAVALQRHGPRTTVAHVVELAGVSRNTFYEFFDDLQQALTDVRERTRQRAWVDLDRDRRSERAPMSQLDALLSSWFTYVERAPAMLAVLGRDEATPGAGSETLALLREQLRRWAVAAKRSGFLSRADHELRLDAAAAGLELLTGRVASGALPSKQARQAGREIVVRLLH